MAERHRDREQAEHSLGLARDLAVLGGAGGLLLDHCEDRDPRVDRVCVAPGHEVREAHEVVQVHVARRHAGVETLVAQLDRREHLEREVVVAEQGVQPS